MSGNREENALWSILDISYLDFFSGAESAGLEIAGSELPISPW